MHNTFLFVLPPHEFFLLGEVGKAPPLPWPSPLVAAVQIVKVHGWLVLDGNGFVGLSRGYDDGFRH